MRTETEAATRIGQSLAALLLTAALLQSTPAQAGSHGGARVHDGEGVQGAGFHGGGGFPGGGFHGRPGGFHAGAPGLPHGGFHNSEFHAHGFPHNEFHAHEHGERFHHHGFHGGIVFSGVATRPRQFAVGSAPRFGS